MGVNRQPNRIPDDSQATKCEGGPDFPQYLKVNMVMGHGTVPNIN